jgi:L-iditol 2-dehydrogenase
MRVARAYSIHEVRVEEAPVPRIGPGEALLEVEACGLCTSDCLDWYVEQKAPIVLGHEPAGTLVDVGPGAPPGLRPGMRVFTHHHVPCGECPACRRGAETSCTLFRETALDPGGFAQFLRIPAANLARDTLPLPEAMDWEAATWIEPLACSLRVFTRCPPLAPGSAVLVVGLGSMGLLNGIVARLKGAAVVIGSDPVASRRERAEELGFDVTFDPQDLDTVDPGVRMSRAGARDGADLVIVGPGSAAAILQGLKCAAPGGTVVLFSPSPPSMTVPVAPHSLYFREVTVTASYSCGPRQTREALDLLARRVLDPSRLVSLRVGLDGVADAIRRTVAKGADLKAIVYPKRAATGAGAGTGAG